ncbi:MULTISPECIES: hypothetical protein [Chitinophaga]|nr:MULTISPECIES: hypothetical protein [Chitinophaga]
MRRGASVEVIKWLVKDRHVMTLGAVHLGVEAMPSAEGDPLR